ncbi:HigA family addiction module antitoxin [Frateuria sp. GZRR35]|uniref:HigA family addiction module antitoxin n=1 Tax=unclassified Frateuria TaxID=2648894 RepID=UPI003EDBB1DD
MHNPLHPGGVIKHDVLEPLQLSVSEAARRLGVPCASLSRVIDGEAAITPDLALRLEKAGVSTASSWVALQANYEKAVTAR